MNETAREYAVAVFELAAEQDELEAVAEGLTLVAAQFASEPAYGAFLASPAVPKDERLAAIRAAFENRVPQTVVSFVCLLCENGRLDQLARCGEVFDELYRESRRVSTAYVTSAVPLTEDQQTRLREALQQQTGHTIQLNCTVDTTLLGGVVVEVDGKRLDGSVKRRLQVLKDVMSE